MTKNEKAEVFKRRMTTKQSISAAKAAHKKKNKNQKTSNVDAAKRLMKSKKS